MFEHLFTQPGAIERYQAAPLASDRLKYLIHCAQSGVGRNMLRKIAVSQLHLVHLLSLKEDEEVRVSRVPFALQRLPDMPSCLPARNRTIATAIRQLSYRFRTRQRPDRYSRNHRNRRFILPILLVEAICARCSSGIVLWTRTSCSAASINAASRGKHPSAVRPPSARLESGHGSRTGARSKGDGSLTGLCNWRAGLRLYPKRRRACGGAR